MGQANPGVAPVVVAFVAAKRYLELDKTERADTKQRRFRNDIASMKTRRGPPFVPVIAGKRSGVTGRMRT